MKRQREAEAPKSVDIVTLDGDSDDDVQIVPPVKADRRVVELPDVDDDIQILEEVPAPAAHSGMHTGDNEDEEDDREGLPLAKMRNVVVTTDDNAERLWKSSDVCGRFVVVLGGDEFCITDGYLKNCSRVAHFKMTHHDGINGSVFYLAGLYDENAERLVNPIVEEGNPWPIWPRFERDFTTKDGDPVGPVIALRLLADPKLPDRMEKVEAQQMSWVKIGSKWKAKKEGNAMETLSEVLFSASEYADLTKECYSLASCLAMNKEHDAL